MIIKNLDDIVEFEYFKNTSSYNGRGNGRLIERINRNHYASKLIFNLIESGYVMAHKEEFDIEIDRRGATYLKPCCKMIWVKENGN